jgi:hypothetical protein
LRLSARQPGRIDVDDCRARGRGVESASLTGIVMTDRTPIRVLVFPPDDAALRREVDHAMHGSSIDERADPTELEAELRPWYRSVQVRQRDALGGYDDDPTRVWYVYRDGRIRGRNDGLERLYGAMAQARDTCRLSAEAMRSADAVAELAGFTRRPEVRAGSALEPVVAQRRRTPG